MKPQVTITVSETGEVTLDVQGARGKVCQDLTRQLEKALGTVGDHQKKPEFYQSAPRQQGQQ
ncbi:DUF2997 domain-containing protein [Lignipirellula cremea]|uniref:DUF2997 domain-containing protein n=1 Tax=Lignipirellula cremea TaxID=2528010 RepID=A0A518DTK2_9BACT|nr:DUF2997 domain-containing protein [Lignipirellula cremea]QDU95169.1 hypothetical protein Pla8534_29810 [Lignipirellula cremea]